MSNIIETKLPNGVIERKCFDPYDHQWRVRWDFGQKHVADWLIENTDDELRKKRARAFDHLGVPT